MRRTKIFHVPYSAILRYYIAGGFDPAGRVLRYPCALNLPTDTRVVAVHESYMRHAFCFVVEHPSFDEVPDAVESPEIQINWAEIDFPLPDTDTAESVIGVSPAPMGG